MSDIIKCIIAIMTALVLIIGLKIGSLLIRIRRFFTSFGVFVIDLFILFIELIFGFINILMNNRFMAPIIRNSDVQKGADPAFPPKERQYIGAIGLGVGGYGTVQRDEESDYNHDNDLDTDNDEESDNHEEKDNLIKRRQRRLIRHRF